MPSTREAETWAQRLARPPSLAPDAHALFLDLDGTLFDLAATPDAVKSDAALTELLERLVARMDGALAVVTGRSIRDADRLLQGAVRAIFGLHGREWRTADAEHAAAPAGALVAARDAARRWASSLPAGILIEDKGAGIAVHYRKAPEAAVLVRSRIEALAREHGLSVMHGKMVSELLSAGPTKGEAVTQLMDSPPFAGRTPVAVGDDATDEHAFAAATRLGGISIRVGGGPSGAQFGLPGVADVRAWLAEPLEGGG